MTVAYEMVQAWKLSGPHPPGVTLDVTVYEKNSYPGGKVVGYYLSSGRPIEHSTRIYGVSYVALFDVLKNIPSIHATGPRYKFVDAIQQRCVLDDLVPMLINYVSALTYEGNYASVPGESALASIKGLIGLMTSNGISKSEVRHVIKKFQTFFAANYQTRLSLTAGLTIGEYLGYASLSPTVQTVLTSFVGIIVAARVKCDAFAIMTLFEGLGVFGSPKTTPELRDSGLSGGNCFPGPSSEYFIDPLYQYLKSNGVRFMFNTPITMLSDPRLTAADAVCIALPHMVAAQMLGPSIFPPRVLHNEWSFGVQFYVTDLNQLRDVTPPGNDQRVYNCVLGSPWQVVYVIEYSKAGGTAVRAGGKTPFWGTHDMGTAFAPGTGDQKNILAAITVTSSNQYNYGLSVGKPLLMCTPDELLTEVLVQVGIRDPTVVTQLLAAQPSFGSILYVKAADVATKYPGPEWMRGPVQANGYQWLSEYTLFIATPSEPTLSARGVCGTTNIDGNPGCTDVNNLPFRVNQARRNVRTHFLGVTSNTAGSSGPPQIDTSFLPLPDRHYLAGEYCEAPNLHIPTMEKACEAGKLAARTIIADFGIVDAARVKSFLSGGLKLDANPEVTLNDNFASSSVQVQVGGLEHTSELVPFQVPSLSETIGIGLYTGFKIGYPEYIMPVIIVLAAVLITAIGLAIGLPLAKRPRDSMARHQRMQHPDLRRYEF
jgi:hypothetical protein